MRALVLFPFSKAREPASFSPWRRSNIHENNKDQQDDASRLGRRESPTEAREGRERPVGSRVDRDHQKDEEDVGGVSAREAAAHALADHGFAQITPVPDAVWLIEFRDACRDERCATFAKIKRLFPGELPGADSIESERRALDLIGKHYRAGTRGSDYTPVPRRQNQDTGEWELVNPARGTPLAQWLCTGELRWDLARIMTSQAEENLRRLAEGQPLEMMGQPF